VGSRLPRGSVLHAAVALTRYLPCTYCRCCSRTAAATDLTTSRRTPPYPRPTRLCVPIAIYFRNRTVCLLEEASDAYIAALSSQVVCAMLRRESQLRNAAETQRRLDELNPEHPKGHAGVDGGGSGDEKQPETMVEALEMIAALRTQLQHVAAVVAKPRSAPRQETASFLREASCDKEVFESIKARVVREFGLGPECVDVLNSAVTRFPGDPDIVASANCELRPFFAREPHSGHDSDTALDLSQTSSSTARCREVSGSATPCRWMISPSRLWMATSHPCENC
jgi:hypothetical protein